MERVEVQAFVNEARFNRFHGLILFWCMIILVCDGYDLAVVGVALPAIMDDMQIDATTAGIMASSAFIGMMLGAIILGTLADRVGRPKMMIVCVALFSVFTAAAGLANDPILFSIMRFVAGLGIGGALPIATAQMTEFAPLRLRARLVTLAFTGYAIGGILVALIAKEFVELYGWQSVFFIAGLPVLTIPFLWKTMPESLTFLAKRNRHQEITEIVRRLNPDLPFEDRLRFAAPAGAEQESASLNHLFQDGRGWSTAMIWIAFMTGLFMVYALNSWLTKLMAMAGHSLGSALNFIIIFNIGSIVGAFGGGWLGDRSNIKYVLAGFYLTGALSLAVLGYTTSTIMLFIMFFIVGASTLGTQMLAYAYAADFYPTAVRSTGLGFASGIGRLGAIAAPVVIGGVIALRLPLEQNFIVIGAAGLVGGVAVLLVNQSMAASGSGDVEVKSGSHFQAENAA